MGQLEGSEIAARFGAARNWWVCTTGVSGSHAVPVWGVSHNEVLRLWGSPRTVRSRNLDEDPRLALRLGDGEDWLIVRGSALASGLADDATRLVDLFRWKYRGEHDHDYLPETDYAADAGAFEVVARRALPWRVTALGDWTVRRWSHGSGLT